MKEPYGKGRLQGFPKPQTEFEIGQKPNTASKMSQKPKTAPRNRKLHFKIADSMGGETLLL